MQISLYVLPTSLKQRLSFIYPICFTGVLFLQYKDEIKRVNMPKSISSLDTLKALFVTSFPGKLSMVRIDERGLIYIKDKDADIFYELEDLG